MKVVGVDPGGRETGVILRSRDTVEGVEVIHLPDREPRPTSTYLNDVLDAVAAFRVAGRAPSGRLPVVCVEGIKKPKWYIDGKAKPMNPETLIGLSMVFGAVLAVYPDAVIVPPGKNGSKLLRAYPQELIGGAHNPRWPHPEPQGAGILRHARSAWDVAATGLLLARATTSPRRPAR